MQPALIFKLSWFAVALGACVPALQTDPAWPGPCYGAVPPAPLEPAQSAAVVALLREAFAKADL